MKNYESPTIESAGGTGNEIEPQTVALVLVIAVGIALALYLATAEFTTVATTIVTIETAVFVHLVGAVVTS
ncbi:hypothetical protein [Caldisericum exile]|uniref:Uncharacterized protein n=1 Tax=Caldisericum exile (strain DSM 21853 / NBRC 104410 / AZM16c01) TaxID=511051 RepID=A0A7U6GD64_CALEA|nr:hypothetical protein [Caldisericum exile]BAL80258.1 hypothetical protein CSE_01320 [Caldisericum exile AZM16c01]